MAYTKGLKNKTIALTFDDGPHPVYTPVLLDVLKKYEAKATFFVVGDHAVKYPQLVEQMVKEGHVVGTHHQQHISNCLLTPFGQKTQLHVSANTVEVITGIRPIYYRPPWGHFNLFSLYSQKEYKTIMWTHILGDWKESLGVEELYNRLCGCNENGSVIVLHDSGETLGADKTAPKNMLIALEKYLKKQHNSIRFVTIEEMIKKV